MTAQNLPAPERQQAINRDLAAARAFLVTNAATYAMAGELLQRIKARRAELDQDFDDSIQGLHREHKRLIALKRKYDGPLELMETEVKNKARAWWQEQERKRLAEQQRMEAEIRRQQEADAARAQAKVAKARAEQLAHADRLDEQGFPEFAVEAREEAAAIPEPAAVIPQNVRVTLPSTVPVVDGMAMKENWNFRIVDAAKVPDLYKLIDEVKIRRVVKALKGETNIPGIEVFQDVTAAVSAARE